MSNVTDTPVPIAWEETGAGPPILLVMGLGYGRWGWEPLVPHLADDFRVITFDNRGIGESGHPEGPYTVSEMAEDCLSVLDAAGLSRAHVVGSSLGGMIAQELAVDHSDRVDRLILLSTTPGGPDSYPMPETTVRLLGEVDEFEPAVALRRLVENALSEGAPKQVVERILHHRTTSPQDPAAWRAQAAAGLGYDGDGRATEITAASLIMHGRRDNVVDHRNSDLLARMIPESRVEKVAGGHLFFWETPGPSAEIIRSFLEEGP